MFLGQLLLTERFSVMENVKMILEGRIMNERSKAENGP
jgi:hypothetical protein